ncbi:MAG: CpXC domain-containing protein [Elusimicrobia bacterium]|nr:CpXC domain-containing protein [Elusimicrobiota bacterium]
MSFQGTIEANCLSCTDGFDAPIWSFVHGGKDALLRDQAKAMECNLLLCPSCGAAFVPEAAWIYYEPDDEILAFVFPMSYKAEEAKWRDKMKADFAAMSTALGDHLPVGHEPDVFFGPEGLAELLVSEDWRRDERDVMAFFAKDLKLSVYKASPAWARAHGAPSWLPYTGKVPTRDSIVAGIKKILEANDRLTAWSDYLAKLEKDPAAGLPPAALAAR